MLHSSVRLLRCGILGVILTGSPNPATGAEKPTKPTRYRVDVPNSSIDIGAAKVSVEAPAEVVEKAVLSFDDYSAMISRFQRSKVVGKSGKFTDVYVQVPILKGAAKVWAVVRFSPPMLSGDTTIVKARMLKGNVETFEAEWRIRAMSAKRTELHLRMRIVPKFPAPGGLITDEVASAAAQAVRGIRAAVESR